MAYRRGDVVLIPFPYTDLTATKTRPAVIVSSTTYQSIRSELLLAYVSSQVSQATPPIDHLLVNWEDAGLLKPSFVRPKVAAIEPQLIVYQIGQLSNDDSEAVDNILRLAMSLTDGALEEIMKTDLTQQLPASIQALAEKSVAALAAFASTDNTAVDLGRIRSLL